MTRTHDKVGYPPKGKPLSQGPALSHTETCSPEAAEAAFHLLEGRWKTVILYHLFRGEGPRCPIMRFSELEKAIPAVS